MWRGLISFVVALFVSSAAWAQQPCTTDAQKVVSELYRHMLERNVDVGSAHWVAELQNGRMTVRDLVREIAKSQEHNQRFIMQENGEGTPYVRSMNRLYRHILGRQPDAAGAEHWAGVMQRNGINAAIEGIVGSQEYNNNFGDWGVPGSGGLSYCAPGNRQTSNQPQPVQQSAAISDTRFRGMDGNNDGVITQDEWRGSRQSFRVHDWNSDGVLTGDEVRSSGVRPGRTLEDENFDRQEEFVNLDINGNNRIERREWHSSDDAFNWLDRDRNNVLTRAEFGANRATASAIGTSGSDDQIFVNGAQAWTDTGITVRAGQQVRVNANGSVQLSDNSNDTATPSGSRVGRRAANAPVQSGPAGGLIARVGDAAPVYVGANGSFRASSSGRLYLGVNDDFVNDNSGEYTVTVTVR
jgi:hypothetical protein